MIKMNNIAFTTLLVTCFSMLHAQNDTITQLDNTTNYHALIKSNYTNDSQAKVNEIETESPENFSTVVTQWMTAIKTALEMEDTKTYTFSEPGTKKMQFLQFHETLTDMVAYRNKQDENQEKIWKNINPIFNTGRGQVTDDTEMAMSMAYGILEGINKEIKDIDSVILNTDPIAFYYGIWLLSNPFDIGNTTRNSFDFYEMEDYLKKDIIAEKS